MFRLLFKQKKTKVSSEQHKFERDLWYFKIQRTFKQPFYSQCVLSDFSKHLYPTKTSTMQPSVKVFLTDPTPPLMLFGRDILNLVTMVNKVQKII